MSNGPLVVKIGGEAVDGAGAELWRALTALHRAHAGGVVLVHGGGAAVDAHLRRLGIEPTKRDGIRLTPEEQIEPVTQVLAGSTNKTIAARLNGAGAKAVGITLGDGRLAVCRRTERYGADAGRVGEVAGSDPMVLTCLLIAGYLPVVASIGYDGEGGLLNVNADDAAIAIARAVNAAELLLLSNVPGVLGPDGRAIPELDAAGAERLIAEGTISGGMIPKVRGALEAAAASDAPVRIGAWKDLGLRATGSAFGTVVAAR